MMETYISEIKAGFLKVFDEAASEPLAEVLRILQGEGIPAPNDTHLALCKLYYNTFSIDNTMVQEFFEGIDALLQNKETDNNE